MKQTVAAFIAKTLEQAGVKRIWGVTGDSLNGLSDSLNRMGTIDWMPTRHEEVAAFAAGAITAQTLSSAKRPSIELVSATTGDKSASAIDSHAIGRDVYSIRGTPLGRLTAIIRGTEDTALLRDALLENLHRANLNPIEEAHAYGQLLEDFGCTKEELSQRIHRSRPQVSNTLRLLNLPHTVQNKVAAGVLSAGHARALLGLDDADAQERLAERIVAEGLSVRSTEEIVTLTRIPGGATARTSTPRGPRLLSEREQAISSRLSDQFDTRVKVAIGRNKGKITIEFASGEDLDRIMAIFDGKTI